MWSAKYGSLTLVAALLTAAPVLTMPVAGFATEQAKERQEARDTKQDTRQGARDTKQECRAKDDKNNAACRQDKRDTKQGGREQARDIKH